MEISKYTELSYRILKGSKIDLFINNTLIQGTITECHFIPLKGSDICQWIELKFSSDTIVRMGKINGAVIIDSTSVFSMNILEIQSIDEQITNVLQEGLNFLLGHPNQTFEIQEQINKTINKLNNRLTA